MNKLLLGLAIGALVCVILFTRFSCQPPTPVKLVNVDSLEQAYQDILMRERMRTIAAERERDEKTEELSRSVELMNKANKTLTESNSKVKELIADNRRLRAANDTLGLVTNCNDLVVDAYNLTIAVDSLQTALSESQQVANDLITMQDAAIQAANDAALKSHEFAMKFKAAADSANYQLSQVPKIEPRAKRKAFANGMLFGVATGIVASLIIQN